MSHRVLVVDDQPEAYEHLVMLLQNDGFQVDLEIRAESAWEKLHQKEYALVITDLVMPQMNGQELLQAIRDAGMSVGVIMVTGSGDARAAVNAIRLGADEFVSKPIEPDRLRLLARRVVERHRLREELARMRQKLAGEPRSSLPTTNSGDDQARRPAIITRNARMREILDKIERVAPRKITVLIQGETGTGKELIALAIHQASGRKGPFVAVNCAALNESLLESDLFGHEQGAFTSAEQRHRGFFERAEGGTLFLDEIGEISSRLQVKLLRILEDRGFERVGGTTTLHTDTRVLAATNLDLKTEVEAGRFRGDLLYRLNIVNLELPPLRERPEDIPLLALHFLAHWNKIRGGVTVFDMEPAAISALVSHTWPGNVRELEHVLARAVIFNHGRILRKESLRLELVSAKSRVLVTPSRTPTSPSGSNDNPPITRPIFSPSPPVTTSLANAPAIPGNSPSPVEHADISRPLQEVCAEHVYRVEELYLQRLMTHHHGNIAQAARSAGLSRRGLMQKLQKHQILVQDYRTPNRRLQPARAVRESAR